MFTYGVIAGAVGLIVVTLIVLKIRSKWRKYWSLDRRWQRLERGKGSLEAANRHFFKLAETNEFREIQTAGTRVIRETITKKSFFRSVLPPEHITNADLDRQHDTDKPVKIIDRKPSSLAMSIPIGTVPVNKYIRGPRVRLVFDRVVTPRYVKDIDELRAGDYDIRAFFSMLGDDLAKELDSKLITCVNNLLIGPNKPIPETGGIQWMEVDDTLNKMSAKAAHRQFALAGGKLECATTLINSNTARDVSEWAGKIRSGDLFGEGTRWCVTDKFDIVPDGTMYVLGADSGKHFVLEDAALFFYREAFSLKFFAHMIEDGVLYDIQQLMRVDFLKSRTVLTTTSECPDEA